MIYIKRIYDPPESTDGLRVLVERLWPRGKKKEDLKLDGWIKDVAPSTELRKWFSHDPRKWKEFQKRYQAELDENTQAWRPILEEAQKSDVTLLFSSRDTVHNNAAALKNYLEKQVRRKQ